MLLEHIFAKSRNSITWLILLAVYLIMPALPHDVLYLNSTIYFQHFAKIADEKRRYSDTAITTTSASLTLHQLISSIELSKTCTSLKNMTADEEYIKMKCPSSCTEDMRKNISKSPPECLHYLSDLNEDDCDIISHHDQLLKIRLKYCCEYSFQDTLDLSTLYTRDGFNHDKCKVHFRELQSWQRFIGTALCQYDQILHRYDCEHKYSIHTCHHCKESYRRWMCSSLFPYWRRRHTIRPCRSVCHEVEKSCPWFLPGDKIPGVAAQYAGEPVFQCIDFNIPETKGQVLNYPVRNSTDEDCCYEYCYNKASYISEPCVVPAANIQNHNNCVKYSQTKRSIRSDKRRYFNSKNIHKRSDTRVNSEYGDVGIVDRSSVNSAVLPCSLLNRARALNFTPLLPFCYCFIYYLLLLYTSQ